MPIAKENWTIKAILDWSSGHFAKKNIRSPRLTAELLLASALACDRIYLYTHYNTIVSEDVRTVMRELIKRRIAGEPTQHLTGKAYFWSFELKCDRRALVPRPETEHLIEVLLREFAFAKDEPLEILEIGTGSGCISIALAREFPRAQITATDISEDALALARENIAANGFTENIDLIFSDVFDDIPENSKFDIIVSNPPYIPIHEIKTLDSEVSLFEPREALDGGEDGFIIIKRIAANSAQFLKEEGLLALEIGMGQKANAFSLLQSAGFRYLSAKNDLQGIPRVVSARINKSSYAFQENQITLVPVEPAEREANFDDVPAQTNETLFAPYDLNVEDSSENDNEEKE